ncbi:MAG: hypothetical protein ABH821_01655 [archaeon]
MLKNIFCLSVIIIVIFFLGCVTENETQSSDSLIDLLENAGILKENGFKANLKLVIETPGLGISTQKFNAWYKGDRFRREARIQGYLIYGIIKESELYYTTYPTTEEKLSGLEEYQWKESASILYNEDELVLDFDNLINLYNEGIIEIIGNEVFGNKNCIVISFIDDIGNVTVFIWQENGLPVKAVVEKSDEIITLEFSDFDYSDFEETVFVRN